jgi:hypothetical protein
VGQGQDVVKQPLGRQGRVDESGRLCPFDGGDLVGHGRHNHRQGPHDVGAFGGLPQFQPDQVGVCAVEVEDVLGVAGQVPDVEGDSILDDQDVVDQYGVEQAVLAAEVSVDHHRWLASAASAIFPGAIPLYAM